MTRCYLSENKILKYSAATGLKIIYANVRGGEGHGVNLYVAGGAVWRYYPATGKLVQKNYSWSDDTDAPGRFQAMQKKKTGTIP